VPGPDLAVHADLADAAGDQLRVLGAEVQDEDAVLVDVVAGGRRGTGYGGGHRLGFRAAGGRFAVSGYAGGAAEPAAPCPGPVGWSAHAVVGRFLDDLHVVHVRFAHAGAGDAHHLRLHLHFPDGGAADVAHGGTQAAGQLVHDVPDRPLVRHAALDAFRHQLVGIGAVLEV